MYVTNGCLHLLNTRFQRRYSAILNDQSSRTKDVLRSKELYPKVVARNAGDTKLAQGLLNSIEQKLGIQEVLSFNHFCWNSLLSFSQLSQIHLGLLWFSQKIGSQWTWVNCGTWESPKSWWRTNFNLLSCCKKSIPLTIGRRWPLCKEDLDNNVVLNNLFLPSSLYVLPLPSAFSPSHIIMNIRVWRWSAMQERNQESWILQQVISWNLMFSFLPSNLPLNSM